jgi:alcohol dehydrogenase
MSGEPPFSEETFDWQPRTRVIFGAGSLERLGYLANELSMSHVLLVADPGLVATGHATRAQALLESAGIRVTAFNDFDENPDSRMVAVAAGAAAGARVDGFVAIGGGSSLDCAKGANFVLTGGGSIADYRGYGKVSGAMLPMIGIPTTAGTGSDAQSYAVITDAETQAKFACGAPGAAFRIALLDPDLTRTQPRAVAAAAGYDALSHAVESWVTRRRSPLSSAFGREAWRLVNGSLERALAFADEPSRGAMLLGAHLAGLAVEHSMLGAAHACANPLSARFGTTHGVAVALMLPHVVRWNAEHVGALYAELLDATGSGSTAGGEQLATRLESLSRTCGFPASLEEAGVDQSSLPALAVDAAAQWTGTFNPRPFSQAAALELYERAF